MGLELPLSTVSYSPEYNPDEYLNQDFKRNVNKENIPQTPVQLKQNTLSYMESIFNNEEKVKNFVKPLFMQRDWLCLAGE